VSDVRTFLDHVRRRVRPFVPRPVILMYHRIAHPPVDPWGLAVQPDHFEQHLAVLRRSRQAFPMSQFVQRLERGTLPRDAVAITFDDGYVDNLREATPRLEAAGLPATLFVTTGAIGQRIEYWWDELARSILLRGTPLDCEVMIGGEPCRLSLERCEAAAQGCAWRAWEEPRTPREATYLDVWRRLQIAPTIQREAAMKRLRILLDAPPADANDLPMTETEVAELAAGGLFEIGGHTVTHPVLPTLDPAGRRKEILQGKLACERLVKAAIAGFAYPHGANDADSRAAVRECGFAWACSTDSRAVSHQDYDPYALPRLGVVDCDGDAFERALQGVCA
jgi:peptidoglycan/xylan/chitin deacetylase (PgdA/CDA1 family)